MTRETAAPVTFRRLVDPFAGARSYAVVRDGVDLGTVTNRRGGWWRASTNTGDAAGSFHKTRGQAADALVQRVDLTAQAAVVDVPADLGTEPPKRSAVIAAQADDLVALVRTQGRQPADELPALALSVAIRRGEVHTVTDRGELWVEPVDADPARPVYDRALLSAGARLIADERLVGDRLHRNASTPAAALIAHAHRLAAMVDTLAALLDVDEDTVIEAADDLYLAAVER